MSDDTHPPHDCPLAPAGAASPADLVAQNITALQARFATQTFTDARDVDSTAVLTQRHAERANAAEQQAVADGMQPDLRIPSDERNEEKDHEYDEEESGEEIDYELDFRESEKEDSAPEAKRARIAVDDHTTAPAPATTDDNSSDQTEIDDGATEAANLGLPTTFVGFFSGLTLNTRDGLRATIKRKAVRCPNYNVKKFTAAGNIDLLASLCASYELAVGLAKALPPKDFVTLYSVSRDFHSTIDTNFLGAVRAVAEHQFPATSRIFDYHLYKPLCIPDPSGRRKGAPITNYMPNLPPSPWKAAAATTADGAQPRTPGAALRNLPSSQLRLVPSLRWLQMLGWRQRAVRDIMAVMARQGLRLPHHAHLSLKKAWVIMDCATTSGRRALIQSRAWFADADLLNCQLFFVKLAMLFSDPVYGPHNAALLQLMLGLKGGLTPLWRLLRRKNYARDPKEIAEARVRYQYHAPPGGPDRGAALNIPENEVGRGHLEGWGSGAQHLVRPDELVARESARRGLPLDKLAVEMVLHGHVDLHARRMLVPTEDEMYMSDDELPPLAPDHPHARCGNVPFRVDDWLPKHAAKARWAELSGEEKRAILADDERERTDDLVFERDCAVFPVDLKGDVSSDDEDDGAGGGAPGAADPARDVAREQSPSVAEIVRDALKLQGFDATDDEAADASTATASTEGPNSRAGESGSETDSDTESDVDSEEAYNEWVEFVQDVDIDALDMCLEPGDDTRDPNDDVAMGSYDFRQF
ncbi:hypothetical protein NKR23_g5046 [Pleurostoma richardsiae]|uniref:Uncharacterized protein n=1 Tax=Pleurostoma richardsiae TaxID=41990 RepID=A0AA38VJP1_9PEZI|nr:hypothetical protein NKR23_g5046 [Pleurostoma richardsiae]